MKAWEWASVGVRVPCIPWAANLPVSPLSPRPASLVWKAAALAAECLLQHIGRQSGCEASQMKVHSAQTHTKLSMCLSFWHSAPYMNSAGLNLEAKKRKITPTTAYLWKSQQPLDQFDISHNLYLPPCHSILASAFLQCVKSNWCEVILFFKNKSPEALPCATCTLNPFEPRLANECKIVLMWTLVTLTVQPYSQCCYLQSGFKMT